MRKIFEFLKKNISYLIVTYILIQLIYVLFFPVKFQSDSFYYFRLAEQCISAHSFYPAPQHLYEDYISAPLFINLLIIILSIYNSTISIGLLNILLNSLQLFLVYKITVKVLDKDTALLTVILYIFYLSTLGLVLLNLTEFLFNVLILSSIYIYFKKTNLSYLFAGVLAAASIAVRPLGWAILIAYILSGLYQIIKLKTDLKNNIILVSGFIIFILIFGLFTKSYFGKFIYTSTNGPANILIGANNNAAGAFNSQVFGPGDPGLIKDAENKTYIEKGEYWEHQAINWIEEHPVKWIALIPLKLGYIFLWDDYSVSQLMHMQDWNLYAMLKYIKTHKSFKGLLGNNTLIIKILFFAFLIIHHLYYFALFLFIILGIVAKISGKELKSGLLLIFLVALLTLSITLLVFGSPRFKYPIIILLFPFAGFKLNSLIKR